MRTRLALTALAAVMSAIVIAGANVTAASAETSPPTLSMSLDDSSCC
jgi:hypothetical protein